MAVCVVPSASTMYYGTEPRVVRGPVVPIDGHVYLSADKSVLEKLIG
jgi:hypothetical protein